MTGNWNGGSAILIVGALFLHYAYGMDEVVTIAFCALGVLTWAYISDLGILMDEPRLHLKRRKKNDPANMLQQYPLDRLLEALTILREVAKDNPYADVRLCFTPSSKKGDKARMLVIYLDEHEDAPSFYIAPKIIEVIEAERKAKAADEIARVMQ